MYSQYISKSELECVSLIKKMYDIYVACFPVLPIPCLDHTIQQDIEIKKRNP